MREASRFERDLVSPSAGLLAAVPVVAVLGGGIAAGDPVAGVTMGAGAMLVGIAWRIGGGRPPLALMTIDAAVMAISTFVGSLTGSVAWLHLILLCMWSLMGGLLVGVGNRGGVVGTQAIIAVVVFGRFGEPAPAALGLAALVFVGGCAQVVFLGLVRWPTPLRAQRAATAAAYRALAELARPGSTILSLDVGTALDEAAATLSPSTLFGDPALMTLRSLVTEGHRIRVQLSVIRTLIGRLQAVDNDRRGPALEAGERALELASAALTLAVRAIEGDRTVTDALRQRVSEFSALAATLDSDRGPRLHRADSPLVRSMAITMSRRLSGLAGQLRAVCGLAPAAGESGGLRSRGPHRPTADPLEGLRGDLAQIRASASLASPVGRHALRLAVVVPAAELISRELPLQRGYWMVVAAATVLRPEFGATFTRGIERALGTCLGVALAGAIVVTVHPTGGVTVILVGLLAWAAYATFPASFAVGFCFITALVVFLLNAISPDSLSTASARLLDTLVGGAIGLIAYALWPTWSKVPARQALAELVDAQRAYLHGVLTALVEGRRAQEQEMRSLNRRARLARTNADSIVARSLSEPATRRIDADQTQGSLGAIRRLAAAANVLRLDAQEDRDRRPLPELAPLAADLDHLLQLVASAFGDGTPHGAYPVPDPRARYSAFEHQLSLEHEHESPEAEAQRAALLTELDEIVDAANSLATLAGLDLDRDREPGPRPAAEVH